MNKWINKWNKNKICVENKCFGRLYKTKISYRSRWWNHLKRSYVVPNDYMNKVLNHERGWKKGFAKVMHSCVDFACVKTIALHPKKATLFQVIVTWILAMCNFLGDLMFGRFTPMFLAMWRHKISMIKHTLPWSYCFNLRNNGLIMLCM
jgi:hypothetical protein